MNPERVRMGHAPPSFVRAGETFFVTVCTVPRGTNQLARSDTWNVLRAAAEHYDFIGRWHVRLLLAMPDHVHLLVSFPRDQQMARVITGWKHFISGRSAVAWQRDFFDHRLRSSAELDEKLAYVRMNPVRAGLVGPAESWPYCWVPEMPATPG